MIPRYTPVLIEWVDSERNAFGWSRISKIDVEEKPSVIRSVGMLFEDKKTHYTIVQSVGTAAFKGDDDEALFMLMVPKVCVISIKKLHEQKKKNRRR